jgi:hypothetical protein
LFTKFVVDELFLFGNDWNMNIFMFGNIWDKIFFYTGVSIMEEARRADFFCGWCRVDID